MSGLGDSQKRAMEMLLRQIAFRSILEQLHLSPLEDQETFGRRISDAFVLLEEERFAEAKRKLEPNEDIIRLYPQRDTLFEQLKAILAECRSGNVMNADTLNTAVRSAEIPASEIGTTEQEVAGFYRRGLIMMAKKHLELCRSGNVKALDDFLIFMSHDVPDPLVPFITLEEVGTSEKEIAELKRQRSFPIN